MVYRLELSPKALGQIAGLPLEARFALAETLAVVVEDPYDPVTTDPTPDPLVRQAVFAEMGVVEFQIWDELLVIVALNLIWAG